MITLGRVVKGWNKFMDDHPGANMRLGQYFMNTFFPRNSNPKIFYEEDTKEAIKLIAEYIKEHA